MALRYNLNIRQENEPNLEESNDNVFNINIEFRYVSSFNVETILNVFDQTLIFY